MKKALSLLALGGSLLLAAAEKPPKLVDTGENLLQNGKFEPVYMHGMASAAKGWQLNDNSRRTYNKRSRKYFRGEDCFRLEFSEEGMTIRFPKPLAEPHVKVNAPFSLSSRVGWPEPPAPAYHTTGRVRFDAGTLALAGGKRFKPAPGWQDFDLVTKKPCTSFEFRPRPGSVYTFGNLSSSPMYPRIGGEINLPGGGRLTKFLVAEDAGYLTRWGVALWRGWLWKLTGVALPIEKVKTVRPAPGAFAMVKGEVALGGWDLTVDKDGITLVCGDELALAPALFDYLRLGLGCGFYSESCIRMPELPVRQLPAIARKAVPRYRHFVCGTSWMTTSGAYSQPALYARNDVDYYHLFESRWDHILNIIMPGELYFKDHPDYFMMDKKGKRELHHDPRDTNPCFSNPDAVRTIVENTLKYADNQTIARRITIETGDVWIHCQCPKCVEFNGGKDTNSDSQWAFANKLAAELAKRHPEMILERAAYASRHTVPKRVKTDAKNIHVFYCLTGQELPCTLHIDCQHNKKALAEIANWNEYLGGRKEQLGFMTYLDTRPLQQIRQLDYLNRYGAGEVYFFNYHGFPDSTHFTLARWNLGEDADKLMEEFDLNYYGRAGKIMHKITLLVDEYARNYEHRDGDLDKVRHIGIWGGSRTYTRTALDRAMLDRLYELFDEAFAAAGDDEGAKQRIAKELKLYMVEDFNRYPANLCKNDRELAEFAARLKRFVELARKYPAAFRRVIPNAELRAQISDISGLEIPDDGKFWANSPALDRFLADPVGTLKTKPEPIPGGFYFKPTAFKSRSTPMLYSYQCPRRQCVGLNRARFGTDKAGIVFDLVRRPEAPLFLTVEGQDDDKRGVALFEVRANGKTVFKGENPFPEYSWGRYTIQLPAETLKQGENRIEFLNITPDSPSRSERFPGDEAAGATDSQWGWIALSEAYILDPNGDFRRYADGENSRLVMWHFGNEKTGGNPQGRAVPVNGRVEISGAKGEITGLVAFRDHKKPKIALAPGRKVRLTVEAAGTGKLRMRLWNYRAYKGLPKDAEFPEYGCAGSGHNVKATTSEAFELSEKPQSFSCVLTPNPGAGVVIPRFYLDGPGKAAVTKFRMELL